MRYVTVFVTDKPMFSNKKHLVYTRFDGNINRMGETVAIYGHIDSQGMEFTEAKLLGFKELELLLRDLLSHIDGRDYAVKILKEQYGLELGTRKTEDDILDWLYDQIKGGKQNERIQEAKQNERIQEAKRD